MFGRARPPQWGQDGGALISVQLARSTSGKKGVRGPDTVRAGVQALKVMDRAMAFVHIAETGRLELAVDIAGEDTDAVRHPFAPAPQDGEARVRNRGAVQGQAVPVKSPRACRRRAERGRVGDGLEWRAGLAQRRVGMPEAFVAAKIRQARIDSHAGPGGDHQGVGIGDQEGGLFEKFIHAFILRRGIV
jgi:hypothetical protein